MSYDTILYEAADGVATITLNRPNRMNALSSQLLTEMAQAIARAPDDGARALVLTGAGDAFCSGADLMGDGTGLPDDLGALIESYYFPVARALADLDIPVISAVNGPAVGAGLSIALSADIVLMARSAYLMLAFANIGLVPDAGATWLIAKSVGRARTLEMALLGETVSAEEAHALGLITRVVDADKLMDETCTMAARLAGGASLALGLIRKQVAAALDNSFEDVLELEKRNQTTAGRTHDFREAVIAFAQKRKPEFKGE